MAGTDSTRPHKLGGPTIILIEPQLAENIGTAARAMLNCGLTELRLVRPKADHLSERTAAVSCGADIVLQGAKVYDTTRAAIEDLTYVYATTARGRDMVKTVVTPKQAAKEMVEYESQEQKCGFLFGRERTGLENEDIVLADKLLRVPLNPAFCSLNLAQAVLLIGYEWYQAKDNTPETRIVYAGHKPAPKSLLFNFFDRLEGMLDETGFFHIDEKKPHMVGKIRNMFERMELMEFEVHTLHGILTAITKAPHKKTHITD
jgi:tRNA/rRNA methyltransferase